MLLQLSLKQGHNAHNVPMQFFYQKMNWSSYIMYPCKLMQVLTRKWKRLYLRNYRLHRLAVTCMMIVIKKYLKTPSFWKSGYNFINFHSDVTILNSDREISCTNNSAKFCCNISRHSICFHKLAIIWSIFIQMWPF